MTSWSASDTHLTLKPGMTAASRIIIDQRTNAAAGTEPGAALRAGKRRRNGNAARQQCRQNQTGRASQGLRRATASRHGSLVSTERQLHRNRQGDLKPGDEVIVSEQRNNTNTTATPRLRF